MIVPLLATFALLMGGFGLYLLAREGRRAGRVRRLRSGKIPLRALPSAELPPELAVLVNEAGELRLELEAALTHGDQVALLDAQLSRPARELRRRPLWLRMEEADYRHGLDHARRCAADWLAQLDARGAAARAGLAGMGLDLAALRALVEIEEDTPEALRAQVEAALDALLDFERELASAAPGGLYR